MNTLLTIRAKGTIEWPATNRRRVITTKMNRRRKTTLLEYNDDETAGQFNSNPISKENASPCGLCPTNVSAHAFRQLQGTYLMPRVIDLAS
jgi:hypothetical protein